MTIIVIIMKAISDEFDRSATKLEMRVKCVDQGINSDETFHIEAVTFESVKGSFDVSPTEGGDNTTKSNSTFTARWIGPLCSPTK